ncbi:MAG: DUF4349 domain-containing protein [bacterium]|nr:DUF4349 domain-containing protein [bacterium]
MNNAEQKLHRLKQQLDSVDTNGMELRVEQNLSSAWQKANTVSELKTMNKEKKSSWKILSFTLSGAGLALVALITTVVVQSGSDYASIPSAPTLLSTTGLSVESMGEESGISTLSMGGLSDKQDISRKANMVSDDMGYEPALYEQPFPDENAFYKDDSEQKQLFDESVTMTIDTKDNPLEMIDQLRTEVTNLDGYIIQVNYYTSNGTINLQLPAEKLSVFEAYLKDLDANNEVEVTQYNVENVSEEVVQIDESISQTQKQIDQAKERLQNEDLTAEERSDIEQNISSQVEYIEDQNIERTETIAEYNLVNVTLHIQEHKSFWEGNYYQYDRSTFFGSIKYELGKASSSLIRSSGKLMRFAIWLAVYSAIYVPIWFIIRGMYRKIKRSIQSNKQAKIVK